MTITTTTHVIPTDSIEDKGYCISTNHTLVMPDGTRCSVGGIRRGDEGRQVYQGPMVPGPWAFSSPRATVIAANPMHGTYGDIVRGEANGTDHKVAEGDSVVFDEVEYRVVFTDNFGTKRGRIDRIKLELVRDLRAVEAK